MLQAASYLRLTLLSLVFGITAFCKANAQDTVFVYDIASATQSFILLPPYDPQTVADSMPAQYGQYGVTLMPTDKPTDSLPYHRISRPFPVTDRFSEFNFPFTAITKCQYAFAITGAVIGKHALLVFNYDVYSTQWQSWRNPYPINPFFNNGTIHYGFQPLTPIRYYALAPLAQWRNFAIIEVEEDIGTYSGHFGLAYTTVSNSFADERMVYNISYPAENGFNVGHIYNDSINGDTMYMRYGNIPFWSQYGVELGSGGRGEYVSPAFDSDFQIRAIRWDYRDFQTVNHQSFYFVKHVLENFATAVQEVTETTEPQLSVFPNPCRGTFYINSEEPVEVYDIQGQRVLESFTPQQNKPYSIQQPGLYIVRNQSGSLVRKLAVVD